MCFFFFFVGHTVLCLYSVYWLFFMKRPVLLNVGFIVDFHFTTFYVYGAYSYLSAEKIYGYNFLNMQASTRHPLMKETL